MASCSKNAVSLESAGRTQIVVLDKTGTITAGQPQVTDVLPAPGFTEEALLRLGICAGAEERAPLGPGHPPRGPSAGLAVPGGIGFPGPSWQRPYGRLGGETLRGGNADFIRLHTAWLPEMEAQAARLAEAGKTPLFFSQGDRLAGIIAVADVIKEDSPQAIRELQAMGIQVVMLTGDNWRTAQAIGP